MKEVGVYQAKTHLAKLLGEVAAGETIVITKHGRPIARIVPTDETKRTAAATIKAIRAGRRGQRLAGVPIRELINEGRR